MQVKLRIAACLCIVPSLVVLGGCDTAIKRARSAASVTVEAPPTSEAWKAVASPSDQDRIDRLGLAWQQSLMEAKKKYAKDIAAEGDLLKPRSALPRPQPTPGSYNCRMISIGAKDSKSPSFQKFKPFFCYVLSDDDGVLTIVKQTGSQRPAGRLWDDDDPTRMIFLGSLALGDQKEPLAYREDPNRDMAGVFDRIGPFKWRLVIPWPRSGSMIEVFELTPVADQPEG
jgi:hypothetical protein